jgi:hypothetical protein
MTLPTDIFPPQSSDLNGVPFHIHMPDYIEPRMTTLPSAVLDLAPPMTSSESPELSVSEITDIQASEQEFASGQAETYDNPQDLISALHASRERHRRSAGGQ